MMEIRRQGGIVLVVVLWVVALLSVMAGSFIYAMRTETSLAGNSVNRARARAAAEAGIVYAVQQRLLIDAQRIWPADGQVREWRFGDAMLSIRVADVGGKIDLNYGARELLQGLFETSGGVDPQAAAALVDAIEDWRDSDNIPLLNGAEEDEYRSLGLPPPKNAVFEDIAELQNVVGMTAEIFQRVAPYITVYGNHPGVDPATASAAVLNAIPGIDPQVVADYLNLRAENYAQELEAPPFPEQGQYLSPVQGLAYHISAEARLETETAIRIEAAVRLQQQNADQPFMVLAWREGR